MIPRISLSTILVFVLAYGSQNASSAEPNRENSKTNSMTDDEMHTEDGRLYMKDISKYSDMILSNTKTTPAIDMGDGLTFTFELEKPDADNEAMNAAKKAIGETPEVKEAAKKQLADILQNDASLHTPWENDAWLVRFLRLRNYDVPKTYKLIKSYYDFKEKNAPIYKGLIPSKETKIAEQGVMAVLPNRDPDGSRIMLSWAKKWDPKNASLLELIKVGVVFAEKGAYEPVTQLAGIRMIFDAEGLKWHHIKQFNPKIAKSIVQWMRTSAPVKIQGIHIINESSLFSSLYNIFKPFITDDLKSKLHFHGKNMNSLYRFVPPTSLPETLGGSIPDPSFSPYEWDVIMRSSDKEYAKLNSYGLTHQNGADSYGLTHQNGVTENQ